MKHQYNDEWVNSISELITNLETNAKIQMTLSITMKSMECRYAERVPKHQKVDLKCADYCCNTEPPFGTSFQF